VGAEQYDVELPFGVMLKCVCNGQTAVWAKSEEGEVLSLDEGAATVQGTGAVTFCVAKNGGLQTVTVDFSKEPVQTLKI
jgi:hypothetical protein